MRGASAIERAVAEVPRARLRALVIWEPVIATDRGPPTPEVRARLRDARVTQVWDPGLLLSKRMLASGFGPELDVVWDVVAVYPPGARWTGPAPPAPEWSDGPVARVEAELRRRLRILGGNPR